MSTKRFINTDNMKDEILDLLQKEFLTKQFYGEKIEVKVDLKDIVEQKMKDKELKEPIEIPDYNWLEDEEEKENE